MAVEVPGRKIGHLVAAADYSARVGYQHRSVEMDTAGKVARSNSAAERIMGILMNAPKSGYAATVVIDGTVKWEAGAAISTPGILLTNDNVGRCVPATTGQLAHGISQQAAGAAGEIISVELRPSFTTAP